MNRFREKTLVRFTFRFGAVVDGLWAVALAWPELYGLLTGRPDFSPDPGQRIIFFVAASLMAGWTALLLWADRKPLERRGILLLTLLPLAGILAAVAFGLVQEPGRLSLNGWILAKLVGILGLFAFAYHASRAMNDQDKFDAN